MYMNACGGHRTAPGTERAFSRVFPVTIIVRHSIRPWGYCGQQNMRFLSPWTLESFEGAGHRRKVQGNRTPEVHEGKWTPRHEAPSLTPKPRPLDHKGSRGLPSETSVIQLVLPAMVVPPHQGLLMGRSRDRLVQWVQTVLAEEAFMKR